MAMKLTRRNCVAAIGTALLSRQLNAQGAPTPTIGILDSAAATAFKLSAFYEGLKVEGFSRNQNLTVEYHSADGDYARLPQLAADLVNRQVTLISAFGTSAALAAKAATAKISIVFAVDANPIDIGLVASLDHPGANIIGVAGMGAGRERKRLELLHAATRLAELYHQAGTYSGLILAGAAPADLPIYQSSGAEMIVNLRSAKSLGIVMPQAIIDQATTLIR
jgi:putative tryptophan/tyrosine transport system substrate-binding protein